MWESFNQLPLWLKAVIIIAPMGVLAGIGVALFIKILKSEEVEISKEGLKFKDDETEEKIENKEASR